MTEMEIKDHAIRRLEQRLKDAEAEVGRLRALLRPFAEYQSIDGGYGDCCPLGLQFEAEPGRRPTLGDCRAARKALEGTS